MEVPRLGKQLRTVSVNNGDNGDGGDMEIDPYQEDSLTSRIMYCVIRVHQTLGPGFLKSVYRRALVIELTKQNLAIEVEKQIFIYYDGQKVGLHKLDLVVEGKVILELKNAERFSKAHYVQVRSYLKASQLEKALLINFADERADFRRINAVKKGLIGGLAAMQELEIQNGSFTAQ